MNFGAMSRLGIAYAGLGRKVEAIEKGIQVVQLLPLSKDAYSGPSRIEILAQIYTDVGEFDKAIDQLELLLSIPSLISKHILMLEPRWDPLRKHPRFKSLVEN